MTAPVHNPRMRPRAAGRNRPLEEATDQGVHTTKQKRTTLRLPVKKKWLYPLAMLGLAGLLAVGYVIQERMPIQSVEIAIASGADNAFLGTYQVREALGGEMNESIEGRQMEDIHLATLEKRLLTHPTIEQAQVYKRMMGALKVEVGLRTAVARIINNSGTHLYIDSQGVKFPTSRQHTAYVPLVRGDFEEAVTDTFACSSIPETLPVLNYIYQDTFWRAQIAEVNIHQSGELTLLPTIGDTEIEFGFPVNVQERFAKLLDYYRQVAPVVGWDTYRKLRIKFDGQVVGVK